MGRSSERLHRLYISTRPTFKSVILDVFFMMLYIHHFPNILRGGNLMGNSQIINVSSLPAFLSSYLGKITYMFIIFMTLHYVLVPFIHKYC
jgi:hypothetical protein